jgi:NAD(P)-dependent dehydrogenase (short-subunit alcohol dehydrogenase family)
MLKWFHQFSMTSRNLAGQHALVTGAAQGIGFAIAQRLHAAGAAVALLDVDTAAVARAAQELAACSDVDISEAAILPLAADVADSSEVAAAVDEAIARFGTVEILVNNAGIVGQRAPLWEQTDDNWARVLAVNLTGPFNCSRAVVPHMRAQAYGRIVNVSSISARSGNALCTAYSASKAGVLGLTRALALELADSGVLVNAVAPALINTARNGKRPEHETAPLIAKIPLGRAGRPEEVASLVHYLASPDCTFSTGAVFDCTGGRASM